MCRRQSRYFATLARLGRKQSNQLSLIEFFISVGNRQTNEHFLFTYHYSLGQVNKQQQLAGSIDLRWAIQPLMLIRMIMNERTNQLTN